MLAHSCLLMQRNISILLVHSSKFGSSSKTWHEVSSKPRSSPENISLDSYWLYVQCYTLYTCLLQQMTLSVTLTLPIGLNTTIPMSLGHHCNGEEASQMRKSEQWLIRNMSSLNLWAKHGASVADSKLIKMQIILFFQQSHLQFSLGAPEMHLGSSSYPLNYSRTQACTLDFFIKEPNIFLT